MPDDLYDRDILLWSERQAALLRQLAHGERLNEQVDWEHVVEEVADVGLSELHQCESLLSQAILHLLKLRAEPDSLSANHWRGETVGFLSDARRRFAPSMRRRIRLEELYESAMLQLTASGMVRAWPETCPFGLDDLLQSRADLDALIAKLG